MDVERAFREAYGPAVATLVRLFGDISLAEDAVQDAFVSAMARWPRDGMPDNPPGWIVATARNRAVDVARREARGRELRAQTFKARAVQVADDPSEEIGVMRDDQLRLVSPVATRRSGRSIRLRSRSASLRGCRRARWPVRSS